jgi:hypothetical protein
VRDGELGESLRLPFAEAPLPQAEVATGKSEYQELKFALHDKLLDRINLDALSGIDNGEVRGEVRAAVLAMVEDEPNLLTAQEKQRISDEVLHEVFRLGPLEPLLRDPTISDILVNGSRQVYIERKPAGGDQRAVSRRRAPAADHRPDCLDGGAPAGRIEPDGGRAVDRRIARERHHSAAGGGRSAAVDPSVRNRQADAGRSGAQGRADTRHDDAAGSGGAGAAQRDRLGRAQARARRPY